MPYGPGLDLQVLLHRVLGVDRDREQLWRQLHLHEAISMVLERLLHALLTLELGDDRAQAAARGQQTERAGHGRFPHAALAGDEYKPSI